MEVANARLRLNKFGSDVPLKDVTPAEAMFLHILHGPYNGGLTFGEEFSKIEVVGTAKVDTGKKKKVIVQEAIPEKLVKGVMLKPAVEEQVVPGKVIKAAVPEQRIAGKPAVGVQGQPGYVAAIPDTVVPAQPEQREPGYLIQAQTAQYAPDQIIPAVEAVVNEEPILADRTNRQELIRLSKKYVQALNKDGKPLIDQIWPNKMNPELPQTFAEINWQEVGDATAGITTEAINYATGGLAQTKL